MRFIFSPIFVALIIIFLFCLPAISIYSNVTFTSSFETISLSSNLLWPAPGYTTITSQFGYRNAPTSGASTYHSGIDIAVPTGSNLIACFSGEITCLGFQGASGYTITLKGDDFTASYCHVSPDFKVYVGQKIRKGNVIGNVGPKNVYGVPNNPYRDSNGEPTNGATTGPHLHFTLKKNGNLVNPLDFL